MLSINKKTVAWGLIYWIVLNISYMWALQNHFANSFPRDFDLLRFCIITPVLFTLLNAIPKEKDAGIVSFYLIVLIYMVYIPLAVVFVQQSSNYLYIIAVSIVFYFVEKLSGRIKIYHVSVSLHYSMSVSKLILCFLILLTAAALVQTFGKRGLPDLSALNFSLIYEIRSSNDISETENSLFHLSTKVIIPILIAVAYYKKRRVSILLLLTAQFLFFLWYAHKTTLFSILVIIAAIILSKRENISLLFSRAFTVGIVIITLLEGFNRGISNRFSKIIYTAYSLLIRRALFVPAYLKNCYYDYFVVQDSPHAGLFGTVAAPILTRLKIPYYYQEVSYAKTIGSVYGYGSHANTGVFGRELAHFGFFGIAVAGTCLLLFLLCVRAGEKTNGRGFILCASFYMILMMQDNGAMAIICFSPLLYLSLLCISFDYKELDNAEVIDNKS